MMVKQHPMTPISISAVSCILLLTIAVDAQRVNLDAENLYLHKEKVTKLRVYVQDWVGGPNPTVWKVAQSNLTDVLPSAFGLLSILDNVVTYGPKMDSGTVGRIQGVIGLSDLHEKALAMLLNFVFTEGDFKGSTLCVLGRNPLDEAIREVPIVGGTGQFRLARGYAITSTYAANQTHGVILYDMLVFHINGDKGVLAFI